MQTTPVSSLSLTCPTQTGPPERCFQRGCSAEERDKHYLHVNFSIPTSDIYTSPTVAVCAFDSLVFNITKAKSQFITL